MSVTNESSGSTYSHDHDWAVLATMMRGTFVERTEGLTTLLTVNTEGLYDTYLNTLPGDQQTHRCHCCRRFFEKYAGLVCVGDDGKTRSVHFDASPGIPAFYQPMVRSLKAKVESRPIEGVFYDSETTWGTRQNHDGKRNRDWDHFYIPAGRFRYRPRGLLNAFQAAAAKLEDYKTVQRALTQRYTQPMLAEVVRILQAEALPRSERFIGPAQWLLDRQNERLATTSQRIRENLLWRAIADAPDGYCHPASSVIGTLLEDIADGTPFPDAKAKFALKVRGDNYQRPTTAPSAASLAEAEKQVAALGFTQESFRRRFALLGECQTIWTPKAKAQAEAGASIFSAVQTKGKGRAAPAMHQMEIPTQTMTWEKFSRTVLPTAESMELLVPSHGDFMAVLTSVDPETPPLFKWANNFSVYRYVQGSPAHQWGLNYGWRKLTGIVPNPAVWGDDPKPYLGKGLCLVIEGAADTRLDSACLFPETMIGELSSNAGLRRVIEAYSRMGTREGAKEASACGLGITPNGSCTATLRVTVGNAVSTYSIDRWD